MERRALMGLILAAMLLPNVASAQDGVEGITYNYSFPAVDLDKYVGKDSWYGVTLDLRRPLPQRPHLLVGLSSGWYVFYDNANRTIDFGQGAVSGQQYRNFNIVPILAGATLMLGDSKVTHLFVGFNGGGYYARQQLDIGLYSFEESNWHWGVAPEAGIVVPMQYGHSAAYVNVRYHLLYKAGGYLGDQSMELGFLTLGVGGAWRY